MSLWKRVLITLGASAIFAATSIAEEPSLNRSLYVPVRFAPCEHLDHAVLYRGDDPIRELPGTQTFQFTYYPNLARLEPQFERVRVEGEHEGARFRSEVVVTPSSVYIGKRKIDLDLEQQLKRLKRSADVRHETVELSLKCSTSCRRQASLTSAETSR